MKRWLATLILISALLPLAGCGTKLATVTGVVNLDGKPVSDATVIFVSEDGKDMYTGTTNDGGNFTLAHGDIPGAKSGTYKVTVTKYPKVEGKSPTGESIDKDYAQQMKGTNTGKKAGPPKGGGMMPGGGGMMPPGGGGGMAGGGGGSTARSELPDIYASVETTPLTAKVPSEGPIKLELKAKP